MSSLDIFQYSKEPGEIRERTTNYIQFANNILDSYPMDLSHGLQKDAIQNGWDACVKKTKNHVKKNWKFEFELIENTDPPLLILSDFGTFGLTGDKTTEDISKDEFPPEEERWARWESLAFGKGDSDNLGARGQGKMVLISVSKNNMIVYDSLRDDGTYRVGMTQASRSGCPVLHKNEQEGKDFLKKGFNLEPISHQGTRIIIVNPLPEVIDAIKNGEMLKYIEETWWPIVKKYGATIKIKHGGNEKTAEIPGLFPIKKSDEKENLKTWVKENEIIEYDRKKYRIKRMCFACDPEKEVPDIHRGIAVFRRGMKIAEVKFPVRFLEERVYGYVECDEELEKKLKELETPNHYSFKDRGIWKKLESKIKDELEVFGNEKLGIGINIKEKEKAKKNAAENKAMNVLRNITKNWNLSSSTTRGLGGGSEGGENQIKNLGISLKNFKFPNQGNIPKLDYGDVVKDFYLEVFNKLSKSKKLLLEGFILSGDRKIGEIINEEVEVNGNSIKETAVLNIRVNEESFPEPGEYKIRFVLKDLDIKTKDRLDEITKRVWVEVEPQLQGPFDVVGANFSEFGNMEIVDLEWWLNNKGSENYVLYYNWEHPVYQNVFESESRLTEYLAEIFCMGALKLMIKRVRNEDIDREKMDKFPFDIDKLTSKDPREIYDELTRAMSILRGDIRKFI